MKTLLKTSIIVTGFMLANACQAPKEVNIEKSSLREGISTISEYTDKSVESDYEVRDGMFYFKNATTFLKLDKSLREQTVAQRINFTKGLGFVSLLEVQQTVYKSLDEAENVAKYNEVMSGNKDIFQLKDGYISSVFDEFSISLLNREGMVSIGGNIHCFAKSGTIISTSVDQVRSTLETGKATEGTIVIVNKQNETKKGARLMASCQIFDKTALNPDGNRRVRCEVSTQRRAILTSSDPYDGNRYTLDYYVHILGTPHTKNIWGSWVNYSTGNTLNSRLTARLEIMEEYGIMDYRYMTYYLNVNDTRSNDGYTIEYTPIVKSHYNVRQWYIQNGYWGFTYSLTEGDPLGTYTSGGVPSGVNMQCP